MSLKKGHVGLKTRSLGQIFEKPFVPSRGHIFSPIIVKHGQNACLDEIPKSSKMGHVASKTRSIGQIFGKKKKNLVYALETTFSVR